MFNKEQKLLETTVREILLEFDGGGAGDMDGYGVSQEFFQDIFDAFIDPFKHAAAFVEKFSSEIQKLAGKLSEDVMSIYLPGYKADYSDYEKEYEDRTDAIIKKYGKVFARTEANLFTGDAALMGFLYAPHSYITGRMLKKTPGAALDMVDMLAGSNPTIKQMTDQARQTTDRMKHWGRMRGGPSSPKPIPIDVGGKEYAEPATKVHWWTPKSEPKGKDASKRFYGKTHTESISHNEELLEEGIKEMFGKLVGLFQKPEITKAIEQSPIVKSMQSDAEKYVSEYVKGVVDLTKKHIGNLKSTASLDKATKGKFSQLIDQRGKGDAKKTAQLVVGSTKKGIKDMAVQELQKKMNKLPKPAKPLAKFYQAGIQQIQSL